MSRYLFVFNSRHLSRTCLIGIRNMIRGGPQSYHFPIEHCVILLYTKVKNCVKALTTLKFKKMILFWAVLLFFGLSYLIPIFWAVLLFFRKSARHWFSGYRCSGGFEKKRGNILRGWDPRQSFVYILSVSFSSISAAKFINLPEKNSEFGSLLFLEA